MFFQNKKFNKIEKKKNHFGFCKKLNFWTKIRFFRIVCNFDFWLQENFDDSYNNLTIKSIYILKYFVSEAEEMNQFLLKTDDDSFVHLEALWDLAKSRLQKKSNNLMGYLQLGLKKHHYLPLAHKPTKSNLNGKWLKWLIPTYMYNKRFFPQFLSGSGYLVTKSAATCLLQKSKV